MKIKLIIIALFISSSVFGQDMQYKKGRVYYAGNKISLKEASQISLSESSLKASSEFNNASQLRRVQTALGVFGSILLANTFESNGTVNGVTQRKIRPEGIVGTLASIGGIIFMEKSRRSDIELGVKFFKERLTEIAERELENKRRLQEERDRLRKAKIKEIEEKNRIDRFYATLADRFSQPLSKLEGVYRSIDQGEEYEYDIAILKSLISDKYIGLVLESTDPSLMTGHGLLSLLPTAQRDLYFINYQDKAGQIFKNKTAKLDGGVLLMGLKSFVKMYPSETEKRRFNEINPVFDWENSGSGGLINKEGYIVTNNHVISGAKRIRVAFQNDSLDYNAVIISQNEKTDVAVLKIQDERFTSNIKPVSWSTNFNLGQKVFTLGYPISDKMSNNVKVVDGIISGKNGRGGDPSYFQTTLPVWYGNSGGPCFNSKGEILGLTTQILWDRGEKVDNVAYITKTANIINLGGEAIIGGSTNEKEKNLEELIEELIPYSVFIKINY